MKTRGPQLDYGGARGSNTGDVFHELWAVRQALRLLDASDTLTALTVEGVPAANSGDSGLDEVDCTLLFGGEDLQEAERVELQQLKYSAATPQKQWTVARACCGKNGKPETSLMRHLGNAFKDLTKKRTGKPLESLAISLVTNQPVSSKLANIFAEAQKGVPADFKRPWQPGEPDLHRVVHASGLPPAQFERFVAVVDFHGETGSRFAMEDKMLSEIAAWVDDEFRETALRLREYVRKRMLPEAAGELITKQTVLIQFGVSDERALFPCPSAIRSVQHPVSRGSSTAVVEAMLGGKQHLCLHGTGGVGKTTALREVAMLLPSGSAMITFDCFGAGSYLDASRLRHLSRDAFVQLSNDLAQQLRLPMLLEPNATQDFSRAFRHRLDIATRTLKSVHPQGLLVLAIDAADNSITAAQRGLPETSFVTELMSFTDLPPNVRLIISARTGRLDELKPPPAFTKIEIRPFTQEETAQNVARYWTAPQDWVEDFHHFSSGVPRVQAYAFGKAGEVPCDALNFLRPLGKNLNQIFNEQFQQALEKSGQSDLIERVCAGLAVLPRPIPVAELAQVLGLSESQVRDICADLAPGVRTQDGLLSFADEDFEAYVREKGRRIEQEIHRAAADRFLANADSDEYAASHVVSLLFSAGRGKELLDFVEQEPEPPAAIIPDPVRRHVIRDQRVLTAIRVCHEAGEAARALRFVLIGAEAKGTNQATQSLLTSFPRLTAKYAREAASRLILSDPTQVAEHGPLLVQLLAEDATQGDAIGVREGRRRLRAWDAARKDDYEAQVQEYEHGTAWTISSEDVAASLFATAVLDGADAVLAHFSRIRPFRLTIAPAKICVDRLLGEGRFELVEAIAEKSPAWQAVFLLVPLAHAGREVDLDCLASGLAALKRRFSLDARMLKQDYGDGAVGSAVIDTVLGAAEILVGHDVHLDIATIVLSPFLDTDLRRRDKRHESEVPILDAILRAYCLSEALNGKTARAADVLTVRPSEPEDDTPKGERPRQKDHYDDSLKDLIDTLTPVYTERARLIVDASRNNREHIDLKGLRNAFGHGIWRFERSHSSSTIRARVAEGVTVLVALSAKAQEVMTCVFGFRRGFWPEGGNGAGELCKRLAAIPELHDDLLSKITEAVEATRHERIGAEDKSRTLAAFAELLIPISSEDAKSVFQDAVAVRSELDSEVMDQLRLLDRLIDRGKAAFSEDCRSYASVVTEIVNDAAIRLQNGDGFPWQQAISSIARLDVPTALASIARWEDCRVAGLFNTLPPLIAVGLDADVLNSAQAAALLSLHDQTSLKLLRAVMERAIQEGGTRASTLAEEFAHDSLVDRLPWNDKLEPLLVQHGGGEWTTKLQQQGAFRRTLPSEETTPAETTGKPVNVGSAIMDTHVWDQVHLTDPDLLLTKATDVLSRLREAGGHHSLSGVLTHAREAVSPRARSGHLDALAGILAQEQDVQLVDVILSAVRAWSGQLAVAGWCEKNLPGLIAAHLPSFARYLPWEDGRLSPAMELARLSGSQAQAVLLEGLERHAETLGSGVIFALAGIIGAHLVPEDAAGLCRWYLDRLVERIPETDRESIDEQDLPDTTPDALARFFFAYMSDVDLRKRWRAAHALRRIARLGDGGTLDATVVQYSRAEERAFRAGNAPFYWLAARLWLVIALDRIAEETPEAVKPYGETLLAICCCDDFPHVLVRDYAADACRKLIAAGHLQLDTVQTARLEQVNTGLPSAETGEPAQIEPLNPHQRDEKARRFHFDQVDTIPYWYQNWLSVFEDLTLDAFLEAVEAWIVDAWGVKDEPLYGPQEPRRQHFSNSLFGLSRNRHGHLPTLEPYRNHLEWHAMWCAVGQLLRTYCLRVAGDDDYPSIVYKISQGKLTYPPYWLSDFAGPVPLEQHRWRPPDEPIEEWLRSIDDTAFLRELFPVDQSEWIVASAYIEMQSEDRKETVGVSTGLVSPETAHALVRALQTAENSMDFYICPEGHHLEIDEPEYALRGWLIHGDEDTRYDDKDPYRNGLGRLRGLPGTAVTETFGLEEHVGCGCVQWFREGADTPSFIYEAWGEREREGHGPYRYFGGGVACSGHRLLVRKEDLAAFLCTEGQDLIAEIEITRRDQRGSGSSYDTKDSKRTVFDRLFLLRRSGALEAAEQSFAAWRSDCS